MARHLPRPRRPRRRRAHLPQRLPLLLRRPGAGRSARGAVREGRRLPAFVPARQLHDADQPERGRISSASRTCGSRRCSCRCTPGTTPPASASWGGRRPAPGRCSSGSRTRASSCTCRWCSARAGTTARCCAETVRRTGDLDAVADLGVVPVSLAAEGDLRRVTTGDARATIAAVEDWQRGFVARRGKAFVHAADEFYLLAGVEPPGGAASEQYENGVGISAALHAEAEALAACLEGRRARRRGRAAASADERDRRAPSDGDARAARARACRGTARRGGRRAACGPSPSRTASSART